MFLAWTLKMYLSDILELQIKFIQFMKKNVQNTTKLAKPVLIFKPNIQFFLFVT